MTDRPTFKEWLKQPADHRRRTAAQVMSKVDEMIAQQDEEGTHAIMLAFKLADRDEAGNTGVSGCLPPEIFKDTIREICGTRMQGWNDFEVRFNSILIRFNSDTNSTLIRINSAAAAAAAPR